MFYLQIFTVFLEIVKVIFSKYLLFYVTKILSNYLLTYHSISEYPEFIAYPLFKTKEFRWEDIMTKF
jgi:hypothetical protein